MRRTPCRSFRWSSAFATTRPPPLADALPVPDDAPVAAADRARRRRRCGFARCMPPCFGRAKSLKAERNIVAELPAGDPLDDATVLLIGRGRHHPTLERRGRRAHGRHRRAQHRPGRRLPQCPRDRRHRDRRRPSGRLGRGLPHGAGRGRALPRPAGRRARRRRSTPTKLPNFVRARDPLVLLERAVPFIRMRALETALKRLLTSIEPRA